MALSNLLMAMFIPVAAKIKVFGEFPYYENNGKFICRNILINTNININIYYNEYIYTPMPFLYRSFPKSSTKKACTLKRYTVKKPFI